MRRSTALAASLLLSTTLLAQTSDATSDPTRDLQRDMSREFRALDASYKQKFEELEKDYDARLRRLELGQAGAAAQGGQERRGVAATGQTSIYDNIFNPAISLIGDFVFALSDKEGGYEDYNRFVLRDVELGIVGRIDPRLSYQLYVHFSDGDVALEEAYLLADDWLPGNFSLKAGRYNMDFGKLSVRHEHDLPFLDKPQVLQEYLGGALRGTGVELHHNYELGDATLARWSVGIVNDLDGDSHSIFGPAAGHEHGDEEGPEPFGRRNFDNLAFSGRYSLLTELDDRTTLQAGVSIAAAPEMNRFFMSGTSTIQAELEKFIYGADVTVKSHNDEDGSGYTFGAEYLVSDAETSDDGSSITSVEAQGFYAYGLFTSSPSWTFGASGGRFEHAEDARERSWDAGVFATHNMNEFNRIRIEARHFDEPGTSNHWGAAVQWTIILGSHGHGIDW